MKMTKTTSPKTNKKSQRHLPSQKISQMKIKNKAKIINFKDKINLTNRNILKRKELSSKRQEEIRQNRKKDKKNLGNLIPIKIDNLNNNNKCRAQNHFQKTNKCILPGRLKNNLKIRCLFSLFKGKKYFYDFIFNLIY
jgi:hypothetical protein